MYVATVSMSLNLMRGQGVYLGERGYEIHVVTSPGPELKEFGEGEGAFVHPVEMVRRVAPIRDLRALTALVRLMRRVRPNIVHASTPKGGLLGIVAARIVGVRVRIYQLRGLPLLTTRGSGRALLKAVERFVCASATRVLCVSPSLRDVVLEEGLCPPEKVASAWPGSSNGVDAERRFNPGRLPGGTREATRAKLAIPPNAPVIGFVGRIVGDKGVPELVQAWGIMSRRVPDLRMIVVGPFEVRDPVPRQVEDVLRSDRRIHLVGEDWHTPRLYAAMDLLVLPTHREGFPNVLLEAGAMGLPVVATRTVGCVDAVEDAVTGTLVPVGDPAALANAVLRYLAHPDLRAAHGRKAQERAREMFRPESIWRRLDREYARLLKGDGE